MNKIVTVEDGSGVAGANSYASLADIRAYCNFRDISVDDDDDALTGFMAKAMDVLEGREPDYKGIRTQPTQALAWPRQYVWIRNVLIVPTVIPRELVSALCYLTSVAQTVDMTPIVTDSPIRLDKVGPLTTEYDTRYGSRLAPVIPQLNLLLSPLLEARGTLRAVRV